VARGLTRLAISAAAQFSVLVAHPDTPRGPVSGIAVEARLAGPAVLVFNYSLHGELARVQLAGGQAGLAGQAGQGAGGLWQHTCFEAFIAAPGVPGYHEFNFSPTQAWAAYQFSGYRAGMAPASLSRAPALQVQRAAQQFELTATVHLGGSSALRQARLLRVALAAVVEEEQGRLAYWALEHPPGRPDFHHPDSFTMELRLP
jgi:hypothetical protein